MLGNETPEVGSVVPVATSEADVVVAALGDCLSTSFIAVSCDGYYSNKSF